jgi:Predicted SPOUT methyltransferase
MRLTLAHIGARPSAKDSYNALTETYLGRCSVFADCQPEAFRSQEALLEAIARRQGRTPSLVVLLDTRGKQMSSEAFATWFGGRRDEGAQHITFLSWLAMVRLQGRNSGGDAGRKQRVRVQRPDIPGIRDRPDSRGSGNLPGPESQRRLLFDQRRVPSISKAYLTFPVLAGKLHHRLDCVACR